jgi:hypothetical protein
MNGTTAVDHCEDSTTVPTGVLAGGGDDDASWRDAAEALLVELDEYVQSMKAARLAWATLRPTGRELTEAEKLLDLALGFEGDAI